jgi:capsular polysaccharide biosynthesis protein
MELKSYLKIISSQRNMIIAVTFITAAAAWVFSLYAPTSYDTSASLFIVKDGTQTTEEFKYDGYYALESGEVVADNIEKMLQSPQLVERIYTASGIDPAFRNLKAYKKKFSAKKMSNSYVEVSFEASSREDAEKLATALSEAVEQEMQDTEARSGSEVAFSVKNNAPVILEDKPDATMNFLIGLLSGAFLGIFAAMIKKYFA